MTAENMNFLGLRIALYVSGMIVRGVIDNQDAKQTIREKMEEQGVDDEAYDDIEIFTYTLVGFADDVRAAERNKLPVAKDFAEVVRD